VPPKKASTIVRSFIDSPSWTKLNYDHRTVSRAVADSGSTSAHFWDLLIAETMRDAGVKRIYTENVKDFEGVSWVEPVNPLRPRPAR
jgi:predicted nucleic acid-binding protein